MTRPLLFALALAAAAAGASNIEDQHALRQVWEMSVAPLTANPERGAPDLLALRFSPDGAWIAALTSRITVEGDRTELLLVPASGDVSKARRLQIRGQALSTPLHTGVHWSPDGERIAIETTNFSTAILRLSDGARCELPRTTVFGGFVAPDKAIAADWDAPRDPASIPADFSTLTVYGADCAPEKTWRVPGQVSEMEISARTGLIALRTQPTEVRVIDWTGALRGQVSTGSGSMLRFGEKGGALCKADYPAHGSLACFDLATGDGFSHPYVIGGAPFDVSLDSSIVVATHGTAGLDLVSGNSQSGLSHWVVWNYRTGEEIGRIRYRKQRHSYAFSPSAVAPDGRRFVLAAGGVLRLYEIVGK
jgi:dipeptidyl aminopeptidase/acylaminoacyl peptidase